MGCDFDSRNQMPRLSVHSNSSNWCSGVNLESFEGSYLPTRRLLGVLSNLSRSFGPSDFLWRLLRGRFKKGGYRIFCREILELPQIYLACVLGRLTRSCRLNLATQWWWRDGSVRSEFALAATRRARHSYQTASTGKSNNQRSQNECCLQRFSHQELVVAE